MRSHHHLVFRHLFTIFSLTVLCTIHAQSWKSLKGTLPTQLTGLYASKSAGYILVSSFKSGVYKSIDGGSSWAQVLVAPDSLFTLQALDDQVILIGAGAGIYKSIDSGNTWQYYPSGHLAPISRIGILPSGKIVAATGSVWDRQKQPVGVMVSSDTGKTWTRQNSGIGKDNALIEALAVAPDGTVLIGIHDENVGLQGKYGLFRSTDAAQTWQRLSLDVDLPFNVHYQDAKLRVGSVFNIAISDQQVVAAIEGVYTNFGFSFTVKKPLDQISNTNSWKVHWVEDSLPSQGSYYEQTVNMYTDSKGLQWSSVSGSGENNNTIYSGQIATNNIWMQTNQGLGRGFGRYLFSEGADRQLFTLSYYFGDSLFVFDLNGIHTKVEDAPMLFTSTFVYPNPYVGKGLYLNSQGQESDPLYVQIYNLDGKVVFEKSLERGNDSIYELLPVGFELSKGFYFIQVKQGAKSFCHKLVAR